MKFDYYFEAAVDEPNDHSRKQSAYHFTASLLKDMATAILISGKPVGTSSIAASDLYLSYELEGRDGPVTIKDLVYINSAYATRYHRQPLKIVSDRYVANIKRAISSDEGLYFDHLEKITITGNLERFGSIVWSANRIPLLRLQFFLRLGSPNVDFFFNLFSLRALLLGWGDKTHQYYALSAAAQRKLLKKKDDRQVMAICQTACADRKADSQGGYEAETEGDGTL